MTCLDQIYRDLLNINLKTLNTDISAILLCSGLVTRPDHKQSFQFIATRHLESLSTDEEKARWAERMRSATTKCLIFQGFPTTINASSSLYEILSPKVKSLFNKDNLCYRDDTTMGELYERGYKIFSNVYKERSDGVAAYMTAENPDLFNHSIYMYAVVIGNYTHLSALETHFVMVVNLLLKESNIQLENHLENFIGLGGTSDQLKDIKTIVEVIKAL